MLVCHLCAMVVPWLDGLGVKIGSGHHTISVHADISVLVHLPTFIVWLMAITSITV